MDESLIDALRTDLESAGYSTGEVESVLGAAADGARQRGVFAPARLVLAERPASPLTVLVRLFLLGETVSADQLTTALPALGAAGAVSLGLVEADPAGEGVDPAYRAALSLNPVQIVRGEGESFDWWILSDLDDQLRRGPARPDHVMGVGGATRSLIAQAPPMPSLAALDLGTGCGIVAMYLAAAAVQDRHVPGIDGRVGEKRVDGEKRIVATDISARALMLARANARLNQLDGFIDFRLGSLFDPVAEEEFDLILSNPPFVITPREAGEPVYEYRDGGLSSDELAASVVRTAPAHLRPGGTLLCLANWETPWGESGLARVRAWIETSAEAVGPLTAWVLERDRLTPEQYGETWARDGGLRPGDATYERRVEAWLHDFASRRVVSIGMGAVRVRRERSAENTPESSQSTAIRDTLVHVDQAVGAFAPQDLGKTMHRTFEVGSAAARLSDDEVLDTRWQFGSAVVEERLHRPGEEAPSSITLVTEQPIARRVTADTLLAAAVGACDGDLTLRQIADALATILEVDAGAAAEVLVAGSRELAWLGMLAPASR